MSFCQLFDQRLSTFVRYRIQIGDHDNMVRTSGSGVVLIVIDNWYLESRLPPN